MKRVVLLLLVVAGCRSSTTSVDELPNRRIIDCVGYWEGAPKFGLKFWGDNPQYHPDFGELWNGEEEAKPFSYYVDGDRMRLWMDHGRNVTEIPFTIASENTGYSTKYTLDFEEPVYGRTRFVGYLGSYYCDPDGKR